MFQMFLGGILLPCPISKIDMAIKNRNKTMTLINDEEINILHSAGLTEFSISVLLPSAKYPFAQYEKGFLPPEYFLNHFERCKQEKKPVILQIFRKMPDGKALFDTKISVSLESYTVSEQRGFDLTVDIKLKQYRTYGTKEINLIGDGIAVVKGSRDQSNAPQVPKTYTVEKGDCLWTIAKKLYGNGSLYTRIYNENKDKIKTPNLIYPGQVLSVPEV